MADWNSDDATLFKELRYKKDYLYDMIIGELNRISVTDDEQERRRLYSTLIQNAATYYAVCIKYMLLYNKYKAGDTK